jgi:hypothetical protein
VKEKIGIRKEHIEEEDMNTEKFQNFIKAYLINPEGFHEKANDEYEGKKNY